MRTHRARDHVAPGRGLRASLAVALVAAQGALAAHFALVRHEYCPETGGFVHVHGAVPEHSRSQETRAPGLHRALEEDSHPEHCAVAGLRRDVGLPPEANALLTFDDGLMLVVADKPWTLPASLRFRLAPKQSPPV